MNNINFTGIRNIGYERRNYMQKHYDEATDSQFKDQEEEHFINIELTDDYNGKDLTEFKNVLKTSTLSNYTNPIHPNFLNIGISKEVVTEDFNKTKDYQVWINDADSELFVNDKNLRMFSYIAKLLKRIENTPDKNFVVNNDYLNYDAKDSVILGEDLEKTYGKYYNQAIRDIHSPEHVKRGAGEMNDLVKDMMFDYFA